MTYISGEALELQFYSSDTTSEELMTALYEHLIERGAKLAQTASVYRMTKSDEPYHPSQLFAKETVNTEGILTDNNFDRLNELNIRPVEIAFENAGFAHRQVAVLTYGTIAEDYLKFDQPPITLLTEGSIFSHSSKVEPPRSAQQLGISTFNVFTSIIDAVSPLYGAITVEAPLETPSELKTNPESYSFRNFYISRNCVGIKGIAKIKQWFDGAYITDLAEGIYVSANPEFNPKSVRLSREIAIEASMRVGKLIAKTHYR